MASGLLLQARGVSCTLGIFTVHFYAFISHTPLLASLVHVVGPLRAAAPLTVDEAPSAGWEGPPASPTVVHPGFLPISIIMLGKKKQSSSSIRPGAAHFWNKYRASWCAQGSFFVKDYFIDCGQTY